MVADDERTVRNECGAAPWTRNERPVNDEDRETNRGEEVSERRISGSPSHARENGPSPTKLIFYRFFYRQRHGRDGKVIAVTEIVSGKTASVRANNSNGPQGHWSSCHPHHFPSPARQSGESDHRACSRTRHIRSDFRCRVSAGSFIPTRNPLSSSGEWGRKLLVHRSCSTHARARGAQRCAGIADPLPTDPLIRRR